MRQLLQQCAVGPTSLGNGNCRSSSGLSKPVSHRSTSLGVQYLTLPERDGYSNRGRKGSNKNHLALLTELHSNKSRF
jgi:hypothetical protein